MAYNFFFFVMLPVVLFSQSKTKTDSLRVVRFLEIAASHSKPDSAFLYIEKGISLAKKIKDPTLIYNARYQWALSYGKKFNPDSTIIKLKSIQDELKNSKEIPFPDVIQIRILYDIANEYYKKGEVDTASYYINKGINISDKVGQKELYTRGFIVLGNYSLNNQNYSRAFTYYAKADSICDNTKSLKGSKTQAQVYNYMGYAVKTTHGFEKSLSYYLLAKKVYENIDYQPGVQEVNIGMAQLYNTEKLYDPALKLLNEAVAYHKLKGPENSYTYAMIVRGYLYLNIKNYPLAKKDYQEYYDLAFKGNDKLFQKRATGYMAYYYREEGDYKKSIVFYDNAILLCQQDNDLPREMRFKEELIEVYTKTNNTQKLNETYKSYIEIRNKIEEEDKNKQIFDLESKYQNVKKEAEITALKTKNHYTEQQQKNQQFLFTSLFLFLLIVGFFIFYSYRNKLKTANKLKELEALKSRFFANISHEFRTPLTLIKSPLQNLQSQAGNPENSKQLELIEQNSNRMLTLVDQLLELSKLDAGGIKPVFKEAEIAHFLKSITEPFAFEAKSQNIEFETAIEEGKCWYDKDIVEKIVGNLLSNALKYTPEGERVVFTAAQRKDHLHFSISNSGVRLEPSEVNRLFERFYQHNESNQGVGIGLALVKELVELSKGKLDAKMKDGLLTFEVELPTDIDLLQKIGIVSEATVEKDVPLMNDENDNERPLLLLADDNPDIRSVLKDIFGLDFHVLEAKDGKETIEIAVKEVPDIIITDVMMPNMDGFELCRQLKQNEITSFIPVILLTAKTGDEAHLKGLQSQADAYITKPFNHAILKTKVGQLLDERKKLRERYSRELVLRPKDIFIDSADEKFIARLQVILDNHLTNPDFTAEKFASEANMSRMQLHRKLKALLGLSAMEFLRHERLKAGATLLEKGNVTISEVAYSVGFNDVVYFSKCFKETYHVTPSEYLSKG